MQGKSALTESAARAHGSAGDGKCGPRSPLDPKPQSQTPSDWHWRTTTCSRQCTSTPSLITRCGLGLGVAVAEGGVAVAAVAVAGGVDGGF